jgi:hypothetical protein
MRLGRVTCIGCGDRAGVNWKVSLERSACGLSLPDRRRRRTRKTRYPVRAGCSSTLTKIDPFVLTKMNSRSAQCLVTDDLANGRKIAANGDEEGLGGSRGETPWKPGQEARRAAERLLTRRRAIRWCMAVSAAFGAHSHADSNAQERDDLAMDVRA